jgi:hypothetical protein
MYITEKYRNIVADTDKDSCKIQESYRAKAFVNSHGYIVVTKPASQYRGYLIAKAAILLALSFSE